MTKKYRNIIVLSSILAFFVSATFVFNSINVWDNDSFADKLIDKDTIVDKNDKDDDEDSEKRDLKFKKPSGKTELKVGSNIRDNKLLDQKQIFKVDASNLADVNVYSVINEIGLKKVYFHFVDSYGFEQRSAEFSVPKKAKEHILWLAHKLKRGSWKVSLKTVGSDTVLAMKRFIVKSDMVKKLLEGSKKDKTDSVVISGKTTVKVGSYATGSYLKEANIINANASGFGIVYSVARVIVQQRTLVYFSFDSDTGKNQRSNNYFAGVNQKGYRLWVYRYLPKGKWTVPVKNKSHDVLAQTSFIIR
ncbi:MAG: hypothetical protein KAS64_05155 [Spirochaetes bacterium]|nr:hypothetical protein [Spirochaetota bacterium]